MQPALEAFRYGGFLPSEFDETAQLDLEPGRPVFHGRLVPRRHCQIQGVLCPFPQSSPPPQKTIASTRTSSRKWWATFRPRNGCDALTASAITLRGSWAT